MLDMPNC